MRNDHHERVPGRPRWTRLWSAALLCAACQLAPARAPAQPVAPMSGEIVRDGDRIVFLGDSITLPHRYTRVVEQQLRLNHPQWRLTFANAGISDHTARQGLARLDRDVLSLRPTLVFVNFGMNDAGYPAGPPDGDLVGHLRRITERLRAAGARVVWIDTTPCDPRGAEDAAALNARARRIDALVTETHAEAARLGVTVIPAHAALQQALAITPAPPDDHALMKDHIHPNEAGQVLLGLAVLRAIGEPAQPLERVVVAVELALAQGGGGRVVEPALFDDEDEEGAIDPAEEVLVKFIRAGRIFPELV